MSWPKCKLALVQMSVKGGAPATNLERAAQAIARVASQGTQVVLLPEALDVGWTDGSARTLAGSIPGGESYRALAEAARRGGVYVCAGLIERSGESLFNAAVLIDPEGKLLLHHRKLNELELAHDLYAQGDRLQVARTPWGTVGVMICSDAFARGQVVSRTLGMLGADIILSPCAWAVPADHDQIAEPYGQLWLDNYQPVARFFRIWIAGASNVGWITDGPWKGRACIGCSLVVDPDGKVAAQGAYGVEAEEDLSIEVQAEARPTRGDGWNQREESSWSP